MASVVWEYTRTGIWRFSRRDAILVGLAGLHGVLLAVWPVAPAIAVGMWWNANTIAHNFIHRPFFRSREMNRAFSAALSVLLGIPQTLWRDRHLAHHAGVAWRLRVSRQLGVETALVVSLWVLMALLRPRFFLLAYLPGYLAGLGLCTMQGYWEHAAGRPTSHYGIFTIFSASTTVTTPSTTPTLQFTGPGCESASRTVQPPASGRRCFDGSTFRPLEALERLVLRSPGLQRFVLRSHRRAFERLMPQLGNVGRATIVGGGLFPRTALILRELLPAAHITIMDSNARNLQTARAFLGESVEYRNQRYTHGGSLDCDLALIPLCLDGDRAEIYRHPPSATVLVHDWIWRRRGRGTIISAVLLKRLNLVRR